MKKDVSIESLRAQAVRAGRAWANAEEKALGLENKRIQLYDEIESLRAEFAAVSEGEAEARGKAKIALAKLEEIQASIREFGNIG